MIYPYESANAAWLSSLAVTYQRGNDVTVRGMKTKEIMNQTISFDMNYPVCQHSRRKLSYIFMAAEAYWITSGSMLTEEIAPYNKHIAQFSDDGYIFNGAYGPMFISQVEYVVKQLFDDPHTRQAVMTIWVPNPIHSKDYRCTVSLIFNIRDGKLNTTVTMRSNDLILGRPYDMFNFTVMTLRVLTRLNQKLDEERRPIVDLGIQTLHAISAHLYETHYELADQILTLMKQPDHIRIPDKCLTDWKYVTDSLLACRDKAEKDHHWRIRP